MNEQEKYDKIYLGNLLAYYDSFLTEKQREYVGLYYQEDYSLQEIAAIYHVTRAGVYNQIQHAQKKLIAFEERLHTKEIGQDILPLLEEGLTTKDWSLIKSSVKRLKEIIRETE